MMDVFLHIPKTGGMSIRTALRWVYGWKGIYTTPTQQRKPAVVAKNIDEKRIKLVRGHLHYGIHTYINQSCRYFTMLRKPVGRILSMYNFLAANWPESSVANMSFKTYIYSNDHTKTGNSQVYQLSGLDPARYGRKALDKAIEHLEKYILAGLQEQFDESLIIYKHYLDWPKNPYYIRLNTPEKKVKKIEVGEELRNKINHDNYLDLELYRYAEVLFQKRKLSIEQFDIQLKHLRRINTYVGYAGNAFLPVFKALKS